MNRDRVAESPIAERFVVVLNRTQDIVNIAGTVRAMMNTGLGRLHLVQPDLYDAFRIGGIAHDSEALLERARFFDTLEEARAGASLVVGTSARRRTARYLWEHPRDAAPGLVARALEEEEGFIALVFGREDAGLTNDELDLCDRVLTIPINPGHSSLNLAQAVLLVGYELWLAAAAASPLPEPKRRSDRASPEQLRAFFADARTALETIEFFKTRKPENVMRTLRALVRRAEPTERETKLIRAMAIEVRKFHERRAAEGGAA